MIAMPPGLPWMLRIEEAEPLVRAAPAMPFAPASIVVVQQVPCGLMVRVQAVERPALAVAETPALAVDEEQPRPERVRAEGRWPCRTPRDFRDSW